MGTKADKRARRLAAEMSDNFKRNEDMEGWTMKRAVNWLWNRADTIGIGCMWVSAVLSHSQFSARLICHLKPPIASREPTSARARILFSFSASTCALYLWSV